jgi:hypothetical protein
MRKKTILIISILLAVILGIIAWNLLHDNKLTQLPFLNKTNQPEIDSNVADMIIYKNPYGYEIKYSSHWDVLDLPDTYGNWKDMNIHHYFSPHPINEELHRLLLKPIGCEGEEDGCAKYFEKYSKKEYSLFEIYVQRFDRGIALPDMQIPDAEKAYIIFLDGIKGVMWTQDVSGIRFVIVDDIENNYRYQIQIRNPQEYGLDFTNNVLPILTTFHLTGQINQPEFSTQPVYPKEEVDRKSEEGDAIDPVKINNELLQK